MSNSEKLSALLAEVKKYDDRNRLFSTKDIFYFEPGMMENLDCYLGEFSCESKTIRLRTESKGLRYDNRTFVLDRLSTGERVNIVRDPENPFNSNNFRIMSQSGEDIGNLPASLCNVLAPCTDNAIVEITRSRISHLEKLSERSRYAKSGVLFVEIEMKILLGSADIPEESFGGEATVAG